MMQYEDFQRPDISVSFEAEGLVYRRGDQTILNCEKAARVFNISLRNAWTATIWIPLLEIISQVMIPIKLFIKAVISVIE